MRKGIGLACILLGTMLCVGSLWFLNIGYQAWSILQEQPEVYFSIFGLNFINMWAVLASVSIGFLLFIFGAGMVKFGYNIRRTIGPY